MESEAHLKEPIQDLLDDELKPLADPSFQQLLEKVKKSLFIIDKTFQIYPADQVALSFNGGKDCTVLLHLVDMVVRARKLKKEGEESPYWTIYFESPNAFEEVKQFIQESINRYHLRFRVLPRDMKEGLRHMVSQNNLQAAFIGNRRTDPYSAKLDSFTPTDEDWPRLVRVCPVLDWKYHDVWNFLKLLKVPYCKLYDQGYTSLGNVGDTKPNPHLMQTSGTYQPAYLLTDEDQERVGR